MPTIRYDGTEFRTDRATAEAIRDAIEDGMQNQAGRIVNLMDGATTPAKSITVGPGIATLIDWND